MPTNINARSRIGVLWRLGDCSKVSSIPAGKCLIDVIGCILLKFIKSVVCSRLNCAVSRTLKKKMANAEYKTLVQCTQKLRTAIQGDLVNLSDQLLAAGLISADSSSVLRNRLLTESERAAKLVALIINRVQLNPRSYNTFIDVLSHESHHYSDILRILNETYSSLQGTLLLQIKVPYSISR